MWQYILCLFWSFSAIFGFKDCFGGVFSFSFKRFIVQSLFFFLSDKKTESFIPHPLCLSLNMAQYVSEAFFDPPGITKNMIYAKMHSQQFIPLIHEAFSKNVTAPQGITFFYVPVGAIISHFAFRQSYEK